MYGIVSIKDLDTIVIKEFGTNGKLDTCNCYDIYDFIMIGLKIDGVEYDEQTNQITLKVCKQFKSSKAKSALLGLERSFVISKDGLTIVEPKNKDEKTYRIPKSVFNLGISCFSTCSLESIMIPDNIVTIQDKCFMCCSMLKSVTFEPNSKIGTIGKDAFSYSPRLEDIELPSGLNVLRNSTFAGCSSLKRVVLPSSLISIEGNVFQNCKSLEEITLPKNLISVETNIFKGCTDLKTIVLPRGLKYLAGRLRPNKEVEVKLY